MTAFMSYPPGSDGPARWPARGRGWQCAPRSSERPGHGGSRVVGLEAAGQREWPACRQVGLGEHCTDALGSDAVQEDQVGIAVLLTAQAAREHPVGRQLTDRGEA